MAYRMTHPEHGVHHCYTPEDVKVHEALGWRLDDVEKKQAVDTPEPKKRGRKPKAK